MYFLTACHVSVTLKCISNLKCSLIFIPSGWSRMVYACVCRQTCLCCWGHWGEDTVYSIQTRNVYFGRKVGRCVVGNLASLKKEVWTLSQLLEGDCQSCRVSLGRGTLCNSQWPFKLQLRVQANQVAHSGPCRSCDISFLPGARGQSYTASSVMWAVAPSIMPT